MKHNWEYKRLGDVGEIVSGSTPSTSEIGNWDGDYLWITPAELSSSQKYYNKTERTLTLKGVKSAGLKIMPIGTVLLSSRAPIGKVGITTEEMYCNQGFKNIICGSSISNEFLFYYLIHIRNYLQEIGSGATFKEISKKKTENVVVPVPPMENKSG